MHRQRGIDSAGPGRQHKEPTADCCPKSVYIFRTRFRHLVGGARGSGAEIPGNSRVRSVNPSRCRQQPVANSVPNTQPAFARLRRASARQAQSCRSLTSVSELTTGEGCLDEARAAGEVGPPLEWSHASDSDTQRGPRRRFNHPLERSRSKYPRTCPSTLTVSREIPVGTMRAFAMACTASRNASFTSFAVTSTPHDTTLGSPTICEQGSNGTTTVRADTRCPIDRGQLSFLWNSQPRNRRCVSKST